MKPVKNVCILGTLSLGLFFFSTLTTANAGICCAKLNLVYEEGIPCKCQADKAPAITKTTDCSDMQSFYSEGQPYPCNSGGQNSVGEHSYSSSQAFYSEGLDYSGMPNTEIPIYMQDAIKALPAAGRTR